MNKKEQPSVSLGAKKLLKSEANLEALAREYDQAILEAAKKHGVSIEVVELKDGNIYIKGFTEKEWENLNRKGDLPHHRGQD